MQTISSSELRARLGAILRAIREDQEIFIVTYRGRPIASLMPEESTDAERLEFEQIWAEMDQLADEISREWPEGLSAAQAVSGDRREL